MTVLLWCSVEVMYVNGLRKAYGSLLSSKAPWSLRALKFLAVEPSRTHSPTAGTGRSMPFAACQIAGHSCRAWRHLGRRPGACHAERAGLSNCAELLQCATDHLIAIVCRLLLAFLLLDRNCKSQGMVFGLLGVNGAGKTTSFKLMSGRRVGGVNSCRAFQP